MEEIIKLIIEIPKSAYRACRELKTDNDQGILTFCVVNAVANGAPLETANKWIPVTSRPITEDELKDYEGWVDYLHPEETMILNCHLPDNGAEVLITSNGYVGIDTFYNEGGECYFDGADIDEVTAWMPLPEPYKKPEEGENG